MSDPDLEMLEKSGEVNDFWNRAHYANSKLWLTGSDGEEVFKYHGIPTTNIENLKLLNIGVGLGHCTRFANSLGYEVSVLDISPLALERVRSFSRHQFLFEESDKIPSDYYDFILCHLVVQHMDEATFEKTIQYSTRALNRAGLLHFQFAMAIGELSYRNNRDKVLDIDVKAGGVVRSPAAVCNMVEKYATVKLIERSHEFASLNAAWYKAVLKKRIT